MKVKKLVQALAVSVCMGSAMMGSSVANASGIPVFDGGNAAQNMMNFVKQMAEMAKQIENQVQQINQLKSQVTAMTGNKNIGQILKDKTLSELPDEWKSVYDGIKGNYKKLLDPKQYKSEDGLVALAKNYETSEKAYKDIMAGFKRIEGLMDTVNKTGDIKAAQDLQNRIAIEQANIQNNQARLDMMARIVEQEEKIQDAKYANLQECYLNARINGSDPSACGG